MKTTLNILNDKNPCQEGKEMLLKAIGKTEPDDTEIDLMDILKHNGIQDAVWCLRAFDYLDYCLFLADVAESVLYLYERNNKDDAPRKAIEAVRSYKLGNITKLGLENTASAAYAAARATDTYADDDAAFAAAYAAYAAAYAYDDTAFADAYADPAAVYGAIGAAYATADAADDANASAAYAAAAGAYIEHKEWKEIESLFIKHFGGKDD